MKSKKKVVAFSNTVFDLISEQFAYVILGKKYAQFSEPPAP